MAPLWLLALTLVLTGCFQAREDLRIDPDGTVSGVVRIGVDRTVLAGGEGAGVGSFLGSVSDVAVVPGVEVSDYSDGDYTGQEVRFEDLPLSELVRAVGTEMVIEQTEDGLSLRMVSPGSQAAAVTGDDATVVPIDLAADVRIAVTYPGRVLSHNGTTVEGSTVVWAYRTVHELETAPPVLEARWDDSGLLPGSAGASERGTRWSVLLGLVVVAALAAGWMALWRTVPTESGTPDPAPQLAVPMALAAGPAFQLGTGSRPEPVEAPAPAPRRWPPPPMHRQLRNPFGPR